MTLETILKKINAYLDFKYETPSSSSDVNRITSYVNQAIDEWGDAYEWRQLKENYYFLATGNASVSLPTTFRNFLIDPVQENNGSIEEFPEIKMEDRFQYESDDEYCYVLGNNSDGYTAIFNALATNVTVSFLYQRYPSGVATLSDSIETPSPDFVFKKALAIELQTRFDERWQAVDQEAQRILNNMIGREMIVRPGGENRQRRIGASAWRIGTSRGG